MDNRGFIRLNRSIKESERGKKKERVRVRSNVK